MGKSKLKKSDGGGGGGSEWLNTYADLVTLLMTFFVLLFSMSSINPVKWDALMNAFGKDKESINVPSEDLDDSQIQGIILELIERIENNSKFEEGIESGDPEATGTTSPGEVQIDFSDIYETLQQYITNNSLEEQIGLEKTADAIILSFKDKAFFASGRADLTSSSVELMKYISNSITLIIDKVAEIVISGHTDNIPQVASLSSPYSNNRELGAARANAVSQWFEEWGNISGEKIITQSFAENRPLASNDTEEGRSENRRVEVVVTRLADDSDKSDEEVIAVDEPDTENP